MKYFCEDCGWVEKDHRCEQWETVHEIPEQALESYEAALEETVDLLQDCLEHLPYMGDTWQTVSDTIFKTKNELGADTMATIKLLSRWNQEKNAKIHQYEKEIAEKDPIPINEKTVERFRLNLKEKRFMVCFVYYDFKIGDKSRRMIDIAKTRYKKNIGWSISCRGVVYLDYDDFYLNSKSDKKIILKYVHSFIECEEPQMNGVSND